MTLRKAFRSFNTLRKCLFVRSIYLYSQVLQSKRDDCAKWTDEASGMY